MNVKKITAIGGLATALGLGLGACGSSGGSSSSYYQSGYTFGQAAQGGINTPEGVILAQWSQGSTEFACDNAATLGSTMNQDAPQGESVPASEFAPAEGPASIQWVAGCVAGTGS
jgi:hypothetical protein